MHPVHLFQLAANQAEWLAAHQKIIAGNVANANTPGFKAREIAPFSHLLTAPTITIATTHAAHMSMENNPVEAQAVKKAGSLETTHSGNNVVLEDEMLHGAQVAREMSLNTAIIKSFHQMMMATIQGK